MRRSRRGHRRARTGPAEAAATWRSPHNGKPTVRGVERLRAWCEGCSLHAGVVIADHDREALERLCRDGTRPAFAHDRLAWTAAGQIAYRLKRPWPDGRAGRLMAGPDTEYVDELRYDVDPAKAAAFGAALRRYLPKICDDELAPGYAGIRPKLQGPGEPVCDFVIEEASRHGAPQLVNLIQLTVELLHDPTAS